MADTKISALAALTGAQVDTAADVFAIVDTSAAATKKILVDELRLAISATQALQEATTNTSTFVMPSVQHFHPSAAKAFGVITTPTTVTTSYPAAGVSVVKNATGDYTVTHGKTFSSANYPVAFTTLNLSAVMTITSRTATTFRIVFFDILGTPQDPTSFDYVCFGDL